LDDLRTERRSLSIHHTGPTTTTSIVGMKCSGFAPRLSKGDLSLILFTRLQHIGGWPPIPLGNLCKGPGVTFSAREVTTRLIDGEVIFRTRKMNGRNQPEGTVVRLFEGGFASQGLSSFDFNETTTLWISLSNQIALHFKILSYAISSLQEKISM
jgi:hypothetical protein